MPTFPFKQITYIDYNTLSGSMEALRNDLGIYWETNLVNPTELLPNGDFKEITVFNNGSFTDLDVSPSDYLSNGEISSISGQLQYVELQPALQTTASVDKIVPNFKIPGRFYGTSTSIRSDTEWMAYLLGNTYAETNYPGIYSEATFDDYSTDYFLPYSLEEYNTLATATSGHQSSSITYHYKQYLPQFEKWTEDRRLRTLPNIALMEISMSAPLASTYPFPEAVSRDGAYPLDLDTILESSVVSTLPPRQYEMAYTPGYLDYTKNLRDYLNSLYLYPLSNQTSGDLSMQTQNLLYDKEATNIIFDSLLSGDSEKILSAYPAYVSIDFPIGGVEHEDGFEQNHFRAIFDQANFSAGLLVLLKDAFAYGLTETRVFEKRTKEDAVTNGVVYDTDTISTQNIRTVNFISLLARDYTTLSRLTDDCHIITTEPNNEFVEAVMNSEMDSSRFLNSYSIMSTLTRLLSLLDSDYTTFLDDLNHIEVDNTGKNGLYALLQKAGVPNYRETIAYRIEKIDSSGTVQNIWFYNGGDTENDGWFRYRDSQVKYNGQYIYKTYAYVLTTGVKYKMGDLRIGRNIGGADNGRYCLQFHNPYTDEVVDQLFASSDDQYANSSGGAYHGIYNDLILENEFASNAQAISDYPYLADFNLYYEPALRILEIPLDSNTVTILDNPAPGLDVIPFQKIDNSQTIGFYIQAETHQPTYSFPTSITSDDLIFKSLYLDSTGLAETDSIYKTPVSDQAFVEIYRMDTKPTSYRDFANERYKTISLKIDDNISTADSNRYFPSYVFHDQIDVNKKILLCNEAVE